MNSSKSVDSSDAALQADFIIVGAGTAGCVLANRLSADRGCRVLLLEAGPTDDDRWIHIPIGIFRLISDPVRNWMYYTEPEPGLDGRRVFWPRGKVLGGSSSINGMVYVRGQAEDFDRWAAEGATGWDAKTLLPYLKRGFHQSRGADPWHDTGGPIHVADRPDRHPLWDAFIEAAVAAGFPRNPDFNGERQEGVGYYQTTIRRGRRSSAATGYLRPAQQRPNLDVITGARAHRILFQGRRATGVQFSTDRGLQTARASRGVIVAGGSVNSPQLLMLSGIGPAEHLGQHGIEVLHDSPGVGANLQDHLQLRLVYRLNRPISFNLQAHSVLGKARMALQYALRRQGPMAYPTAQTGLFARSSPQVPTPDLQYHFSNYSFDAATRQVHRFPGMTYSVCQLRPRSRGRITLRAPDPAQPVRIEANYLSALEDQEAAVAAVALTRRLASSSPMRELVQTEIAPGPDVRTREQILAFARSNGTSIYHPVGTCRMGSDERAVVDPELRVRGVQNLWVVDASVMPSLTSGNTNAAVVAIAERASEFLTKT